jgi:hypothetical protein
MRLAMLPIAMAVMIGSQAVGDDAPPVAKAGPKGAKKVLDPTWRLNSGDQAEIAVSGVIAGAEQYSLVEVLKLYRARDRAGLDEMEKNGTAMSLEKGTSILIIRSLRTEADIAKENRPSSSRTLSGSSLGSAVQSGVSAPDTTEYPFEIRILDGKYKDKTGWLMGGRWCLGNPPPALSRIHPTHS